MGKKCSSLPFKHGRVQIGQYDSIIHGIEKWIGNRVTFCFNVKRKVMEHFYQFDNNYYQQYLDVNLGKDNKKFICKFVNTNE